MLSSSLVSSGAGAALRAAARSCHQPRVTAARMPNAGNAGQLEMENGGGVAGDGWLGKKRAETVRNGCQEARLGMVRK